jgi:glutamate N-acetyltransferase/amino-acid N-acetyltransferase
MNKTKKDLGLIYCKEGCISAALYTTNVVKGAPIAVTQKHLENNMAKAVIVNSGNANTCNADGFEKAVKMCTAVAKELNINASDVIVASTGVIGQPLNIGAIESGIPLLASSLSKEGGRDVAEAIMTTDTCKKELAIKFELDGKEIIISAIAKGSGMINPNMATLLSFVTTDINISKPLLEKAFRDAVENSLNRVSVDGDTSTNDMAVIMASGLSGNNIIEAENEGYKLFYEALMLIMSGISKMVAKDGEGATKLIICELTGAVDTESAKILSKSVIMSNLVKAAMFGKDANWGRILCALGYSGVMFDETKVGASFVSKNGRVDVCKNGASVDFDEEYALAVLDADEITIVVDMGSGAGRAFAYGCDLTYDYVKINGSYRT